VGLGNLNPGCNCCGGCLVFTDDFSSGDALSVSYTGDTGSFAKSGGVVTTTSASKMLLWNQDGPAAGAIAAQAGFKSSVSGNKVRVIVAYKDANTYMGAEWQIKTGTPNGYLALFEVVGGVETQLISRTINVATNTVRFLRACYDPSLNLLSSMLVVAATDVTVGILGRRLHSEVTASTGLICGFGTGPTVTGTVTIDDFKVYSPTEGDTDCPVCSICQGCTEDLLDQPDQLSVVIDGLVSSGSPCSQAECDALEGTYVINRRYDLDSDIGCVWKSTFTGGLPACIAAVSISVQMRNSATDTIRVLMEFDGIIQTGEWFKSSGSFPYACDSLSSEVVAFTTAPGTCTGPGAENSTATVSAV